VAAKAKCFFFELVECVALGAASTIELRQLAAKFAAKFAAKLDTTANARVPESAVRLASC
jgi:hypothetical protein